MRAERRRVVVVVVVVIRRRGVVSSAFVILRRAVVVSHLCFFAFSLSALKCAYLIKKMRARIAVSRTKRQSHTHTQRERV